MNIKEVTHHYRNETPWRWPLLLQAPGTNVGHRFHFTGALWWILLLEKVSIVLIVCECVGSYNMGDGLDFDSNTISRQTFLFWMRGEVIWSRKSGVLRVRRSSKCFLFQLLNDNHPAVILSSYFFTIGWIGLNRGNEGVKTQNRREPGYLGCRQAIFKGSA